MADIKYSVKATLPLFAPKGKVPYIEDGDLKLADSRFIVRHLKTQYKDLDEDLTSAESALSLAMQRSGSICLNSNLHFLSGISAGSHAACSTVGSITA
jgi:glutathione S-transferase